MKLYFLCIVAILFPYCYTEQNGKVVQFSTLFETPKLDSVPVIVFRRQIDLFDEGTTGIIRMGQFTNNMKSAYVFVVRNNGTISHTLAGATVDISTLFSFSIPLNSIGDLFLIYASTIDPNKGTAIISIV